MDPDMQASRLHLNYTNSYMDNTQLDRLAALERDKVQQFDMREM